MLYDSNVLNNETTSVHNVPNGGVAILDSNDKLVAYNKSGEPNGSWDWVRQDCRK